jgi:hypothetical protein
MHQKTSRRAARISVRNLLFATLASIVLSGSLAWREAPARLLADHHDVPFRFMESTILETQAALEAGTITSEPSPGIPAGRAEEPAQASAPTSRPWAWAATPAGRFVSPRRTTA